MKRALMAQVALCSLLCSFWAYAAGSADTSNVVTAASFREIAEDPTVPRQLFLGGVTVSPDGRESFDKALAACRRALKVDPKNSTVRANLGALYLLRDNFHPEESGGFAKGIDQFLVALRDDPVNSTALAYLGADEVFTRIPALLPRETGDAVEAALRRSMEKYPRNPAVLSTLSRHLLFLDRTAEAYPLTVSLMKIAPEEFPSQWLFGIVELKNGAYDRAHAAFDAALERASDNIDKASAKLGLAHALKGLGQLEEASIALYDSTRLVPRERMDLAARGARIASPEELGWELGKAFASRGDIARAIDYMTVNDINWLGSMQAEEKNKEGVRLYDGKDFSGARRAFLEAVQFIPLNSVYWRNLASTSYQLGRYRESIWAFEKAKEIEPPGLIDVHHMAISFAVLGDYGSARDLLEKGVRDFPNDAGLKSWTVVMSYAVGGWDDAWKTWSRLFRPSAERTIANSYEMFLLCWGGLDEISGRAEKGGMRYLSLRHESLLYRALGEGLSRRLLNDAGRKEVVADREKVFRKIADNYLQLPLKPILPSDARAVALQAKTSLDVNDWSKAIERYKQASEIAPWWPDGHNILALLASQYPYSYELEKYYVHDRDGKWYDSATRENDDYLALIPDGPDARKARKRKEGWLEIKGPWTHPGKDEE